MASSATFFGSRHMLRLAGNVGIGHVRYPTAGGAKSSEAQPFYVNSPYGICLAHNGNLTNHDELTELLIREDRRHLSTTSDSEVLAERIRARVADSRANGRPTAGADFRQQLRPCIGVAVAATQLSRMIVGFGVVAFRDPNGIRPLVLGERKN